MTEVANQQITADKSVLSKICHFDFPTVYKDCYQIETITKDQQLYPIDTANPTPSLYQLLDNILLDKYSNFNGGVQAACACASNIHSPMHSQVES